MNHYEGNNIGSIAKLEITSCYLISGFNPVTFYPGGSWINVPFKEQTGELKEETEDHVNGTIYTYSGSIFVPNLRDEIDATMRMYIGQTSMIRATDMNGRVYILGSPHIPVMLNSSGNTSKTFIGENGKEFQFKVEQNYPALRM